jgi:ribonuclease HII
MSASPRPVSTRGVGRAPSLRWERELHRLGSPLVAGMDEVGRGALGGPVSVGVVVVDAAATTAPSGLRDSKLLTPGARVALVPRLRRWARAHAVGHATSQEIDRFGIIAALRLAGLRALASLSERPDVVILDGNHDWLTRPQAQGDLFAASMDPTASLPAAPAVRTRIKADLTCSSVAAASVLAKVERDAMMVELDAVHPGYNWAANKGYAAPEHLAALRSLGPCVTHRLSWNLTTAPSPATGSGSYDEEIA